MKIVVEANIPYIKGRLEPFAQVEYLSDKEIDAKAVKDADALIVRTRTKCNEHLLGGSKCKFIGTATIGTDHIDIPYCESQNIMVCNAPGCNAPAVAQYVISTIGRWMAREGIEVAENLTLGIVGVGNVGTIIERWSKEIGFRVLLNDPPRSKAEGESDFVTIDTIKKECDIITFHTPLVKSGDYKTEHLCDAKFLSQLQNCRLLINSARGEIVDNVSLVEQIKNSDLNVAIDCWENEPIINEELLKSAFVSTPHIAGYSAEGKMRATAMVLEQLGRAFDIEIDIPNVATPQKGAIDVTLEKVIDSYNPLVDTTELKLSPNTFEEQRNHYILRHEV